MSVDASTRSGVSRQQSDLPVLAERFRAMASDIYLAVVSPSPTAIAAVDDAREIFRRIEQTGTRFNADSALMRANAAGNSWCEAPPELLAVVAEAHSAYLRTSARFDPRILKALERSGYDRSLDFAADLQLPANASERPPAPVASRPWSPSIDAVGGRLRIGPDPIDLGGIGKGLAVRAAAERLSQECDSFMIEAGGDCYFAGRSYEGTAWRVSVEDPAGDSLPVAVLELTDAAVATSSIRRRKWHVGDDAVHHLIDPATGESGGQGLQSVTVVGPDTADAEVWSKVLFLAGRADIAQEAKSHGIDALWVDDRGRVATSEFMPQHVIWRNDSKRIND